MLIIYRGLWYCTKWRKPTDFPERCNTMDIFNVLSLIGGLCLFLYGMNVMGQALERRAGSSLRSILSKLTTNQWAGLLTGLGVTAVIQSSSATTVMVVGFVNSGLMSLKQSINVIMGANIGTTVTAWILSLSGIEGDSLLIQLLKPMSFTPILALVGIILYMFTKNDKKQDTGTILLGFAVLMFGMDIMSDSVSGLADVPEFRNLFLLFRNPVLGVLAGAVLTAVIQSSSASVGILQALSATGQVTLGAAIPIIMGQNIGTCITAILSSFGTNKNARRAAVVHLMFNVIGTAIWLAVFSLVQAVLQPAILDVSANEMSIAVAHSAFNIACTLLLLPQTGLLEKLAYKLVPEGKKQDQNAELDELLLQTPPLALEQSRKLTCQLGRTACEAMQSSLTCLAVYDEATAESVRKAEARTDHYEDVLGSYLVKLSTLQISRADSAEAAGMLKIISDFERIGDHAVNVLESAEELLQKEQVLSPEARQELCVLCSAVNEVMTLAAAAFANRDHQAAARVEALEQVVDELKDTMRTRHIQRLQQGKCTIETGFVWVDLLTDLERTSDHCSNIAKTVLDMELEKLALHQQDFRMDPELYRNYRSKYAL